MHQNGGSRDARNNNPRPLAVKGVKGCAKHAEAFGPKGTLTKAAVPPAILTDWGGGAGH